LFKKKKREREKREKRKAVSTTKEEGRNYYSRESKAVITQNRGQR